jgi:hypothetical protein
MSPWIIIGWILVLPVTVGSLLAIYVACGIFAEIFDDWRIP